MIYARVLSGNVPVNMILSLVLICQLQDSDAHTLSYQFEFPHPNTLKSQEST